MRADTALTWSRPGGRRLRRGRGWLIGAVVWLLLAGGAAARTWTSRDGKSVQGTYMCRNGQGVIIIRSRDGMEVTIPLNDLSDADRQYVEDREHRSVKNTIAADMLAPSSTVVEVWQLIGRTVPFAGALAQLPRAFQALVVLAGLLGHTIFLLLAARLVRFRGGYSDAVKATALNLILLAGVFLGTVAAMKFAGGLGGIMLLLCVAVGPVAIHVVYNGEFILAILAHVLAVLLTGLTATGLIFVFAATGL